MQRVIVDSDIVVDHLRNYSYILEEILSLTKEKEVRAYLPSVVYAEIYSGQDTKEEKKVGIIEKLLDSLEFVEDSKEISKQAGFLLRDYKHLKIGDAFVAATALSLNAKLATRNMKDFESIKGLDFFEMNKKQQN